MDPVAVIGLIALGIVALLLLAATANQIVLGLATLEMLRRLNLRTKVRWPALPGFGGKDGGEVHSRGGSVSFPIQDEEDRIIAERRQAIEEGREAEEEEPTALG